MHSRWIDMFDPQYPFERCQGEQSGSSEQDVSDYCSPCKRKHCEITSASSSSVSPIASGNGISDLPRSPRSKTVQGSQECQSKLMTSYLRYMQSAAVRCKREVDERTSAFELGTGSADDEGGSNSPPEVLNQRCSSEESPLTNTLPVSLPPSTPSASLPPALPAPATRPALPTRPTQSTQPTLPALPPVPTLQVLPTEPPLAPQNSNNFLDWPRATIPSFSTTAPIPTTIPTTPSTPPTTPTTTTTPTTAATTTILGKRPVATFTVPQEDIITLTAIKARFHGLQIPWKALEQVLQQPAQMCQYHYNHELFRRVDRFTLPQDHRIYYLAKELTSLGLTVGWSSLDNELGKVSGECKMRWYKYLFKIDDGMSLPLSEFAPDDQNQPTVSTNTFPSSTAASTTPTTTNRAPLAASATLTVQTANTTETLQTTISATTTTRITTETGCRRTSRNNSNPRFAPLIQNNRFYPVNDEYILQIAIKCRFNGTGILWGTISNTLCIDRQLCQDHYTNTLRKHVDKFTLQQDRRIFCVAKKMSLRGLGVDWGGLDRELSQNEGECKLRWEKYLSRIDSDAHRFNQNGDSGTPLSVSDAALVPSLPVPPVQTLTLSIPLHAIQPSQPPMISLPTTNDDNVKISAHTAIGSAATACSTIDTECTSSTTTSIAATTTYISTTDTTDYRSTPATPRIRTPPNTANSNIKRRRNTYKIEELITLTTIKCRFHGLLVPWENIALTLGEKIDWCKRYYYTLLESCVLSFTLQQDHRIYYLAKEVTSRGMCVEWSQIDRDLRVLQGSCKKRWDYYLSKIDTIVLDVPPVVPDVPVVPVVPVLEVVSRSIPPKPLPLLVLQESQAPAQAPFEQSPVLSSLVPSGTRV